VEGSLWKEMIVLFCKSLINIFTFMFAQSSFCIQYMAVVNLNSGFDTCYSVDLTVEKFGYMHEVLALFSFFLSMGVWSIMRLYDFEKNDKH
jgi:hypothetical protein